MFGKRCTLCGGKLKGNICTECGLDNSKSEKNYRINQSSCDGMPLTHVHEEPQEHRKQNNTRKKQKQKTARKTFKGNKIGLIIFIIIFAVSMAGSIRNVIWDLIYEIKIKTGISEEYDYEYEPVNPYEYVEAKLPAGEHVADYMLDAGEYIVGVHIPSGNYIAEPEGDFDTVTVDDRVNSIYLYEYRGKEGENYLDDLRLYPGAKVTISADNPIRLSTENGDYEGMNSMENPLTEQVVLEGGRAGKAGEDFEAGVYDVHTTEGHSSARLAIYDENGEEYTSGYFYFSADGQNIYRNLVMPEGASLEFEEEEITLALTPSERIGSTDYTGYYIY